MFIPPFLTAFLFNKIDDEGDNGGGETDSEFDPLGVPEAAVDQVADNAEDQNTDNTEEKIDPNWQGILNGLPQEFHKQVIPQLKTWDQNFAKVQSDYAPYKPLLENGIKYEDIQNSIELTKLINANPRYVYDELAKRYGFAAEQGQQQEEDDEDNADDAQPNLLELENNPQLKAMQDKLDQFQHMFDEQQQAKKEQAEQEAAVQEVKAEWTTLYTKLGIPEGKDLPQQVKNEIIQRSVAIGDKTGEYSLLKGYEDYASFVNFVRNTRANATAPAVLPGNGGLPSTKKNIGQMTEDERIEHIAGFAKALAEGNGS